MTWQCPRCMVTFRTELPHNLAADNVARCENPSCHVRYADGSQHKKDGHTNNAVRMYLLNTASPHMSEDYL